MTVIEDGLTLKQWRGLRGLSQKELSEKSGITTDTISNYEKNPEAMERAMYSTLKSLADALDIKVENFFN